MRAGLVWSIPFERLTLNVFGALVRSRKVGRPITVLDGNKSPR